MLWLLALRPRPSVWAPEFKRLPPPPPPPGPGGGGGGGGGVGGYVRAPLEDKGLLLEIERRGAFYWNIEFSLKKKKNSIIVFNVLIIRIVHLHLGFLIGSKFKRFLFTSNLISLPLSVYVNCIYLSFCMYKPSFHITIKLEKNII